MTYVNAFAITALHHIEVADDLGDGLQIHGDLYIVNSRDRIENLMASNFRSTIGPMEANALLAAPAVLVEFSSMRTAETDDASLQARLVNFLRRCQQFTLCAWLEKDNAVDFELGFLEVPHRARISKVSSNLLAVSYRDAAGTEAARSFSREELTLIGRSLARFGPMVESPATAQVNRVERAIYLIHAARAQSDPTLRIAFSCMCLEALLSNATTELAHKLSERVAWLLANNPEERWNLFVRTKEAYAVRSSILHGDGVKKSMHAKLGDVAVHCDGVLRTLMASLLSGGSLSKEFARSQEELESYLTRLCLGFAERQT